MLDSIYHMTFELFKNHIFGMKTSRFSPLLRSIKMDGIVSHYEICKPLVVHLFYCMVLYHSQPRHHVINAINMCRSRKLTGGGSRSI